MLDGSRPVGDQQIRRLFKQLDRAGGGLVGEVNLRAPDQERAKRHRLVGQLQAQDQAATDEGRRQRSLLVRGDDNQRKAVPSLDRLFAPETCELSSAERLEQSVRDVGFRLVNLVDQHDTAIPGVRSCWRLQDLRSGPAGLFGRPVPVESPPKGSGTDELLDGKAVFQKRRMVPL